MTAVMNERENRGGRPSELESDGVKWRTKSVFASLKSWLHKG
jgi:hypothetical protein